MLRYYVRCGRSCKTWHLPLRNLLRGGARHVLNHAHTACWFPTGKDSCRALGEQGKYANCYLVVTQATERIQGRGVVWVAHTGLCGLSLGERCSYN